MSATLHLLQAAECFYICFDSQCLVRADTFHTLLPFPRIVCYIPDFGTHVTRRDRGLSSLASGGEKMRDPGNEVDKLTEVFYVIMSFR